MCLCVICMKNMKKKKKKKKKNEIEDMVQKLFYKKGGEMDLSNYDFYVFT